MTSLPLHHQRLQNIQRQLPNVINYFVAGPTDCKKVQMLLYPYTPFICKALYFDLECFKYLLDLYEKVKPTIEKLFESGKLEKNNRLYTNNPLSISEKLRPPYKFASLFIRKRRYNC